MCAASQSPGREPTSVDNASEPACQSKITDDDDNDDDDDDDFSNKK